MATVQTNSTNDEVDEWTKPPFLRRVRIRGYKSIAFCEVELKPLTILVGRNASGKSNFIDALVFLRDLVSAGVKEAVKRHGGRDAIVCRLRSDNRVCIEIETSFRSEKEDGELWSGVYATEIELPEKRPPEITHEHLRLEGGRDKVWFKFTNNNGRITTSADPISTTKRHWYFARERTWQDKDSLFLHADHPTPVTDFADVLTCLTAYNFHPDAIRRLQKPTLGSYLERDGSNLASVIESTREIEAETISRVGVYLSTIVEDVESFRPVRYGEYETIRFRMRAGVGQHPLEFDAGSMSDGTLRALAALVAVFQYPLGPSLVCIEEPETSLHPAAMRALVSALDEATGRTQVLLTTHSAELLEDRDLSPSQILVVRNKDGQTQIAPVDPASQEIIRKELYTLPELHRQDHLEPDAADLQRQAELARMNGEG